MLKNKSYFYYNLKKLNGKYLIQKKDLNFWHIIIVNCCFFSNKSKHHLYKFFWGNLCARWHYYWNFDVFVYCFYNLTCFNNCGKREEQDIFLSKSGYKLFVSNDIFGICGLFCLLTLFY
jgi:hypothetical protein